VWCGHGSITRNFPLAYAWKYFSRMKYIHWNIH